jgi:ankyrin repeat protein
MNEEVEDLEDQITEDELIFNTISSLEKILDRFSRSKKQESHRVAFAAALRKFAHFIDDPPTEDTREPFPTKWLRQQFLGSTTRSSDNWLPLHWILCDEAPKVELVESLLEETGDSAFNEDVSPLSIAVAQRNPSGSTINAIISYKPTSVSTPDKDGAMAMMYASAWNDSEMVVHMLWKHCPEAMSTIDKYDC